MVIRFNKKEKLELTLKALQCCIATSENILVTPHKVKYLKALAELEAKIIKALPKEDQDEGK